MEASSEEAEREEESLKDNPTRRKKKEEGLRVELFVLLTSMLFLPKSEHAREFPLPLS